MRRTRVLTKFWSSTLKTRQALQLRTQLASAQEQIANQARTQQVEQHYADAQAAFAKQDFDAAEKSLVALLALDAANAPALELQDKIQNARQQAVRVQQERDRKQQIENLFGQAQSAFTQKDYDAADKALAALFALDASNASARNLQKQIQDARKRAEPTPLTSSERIFAPPGIPERAETNLKSPTPAIVSDRSQGFPTRYALPIAGVIILALLLLGGGAYALGVFNPSRQTGNAQMTRTFTQVKRVTKSQNTIAAATAVSAGSKATTQPTLTILPKHHYPRRCFQLRWLLQRQPEITLPTTTLAATVEPAPSIGIVKSTLNVREQPTTSGTLLGVLKKDDVVTLVGRTADNAWLQINYPLGTTAKAWASAQFIDHSKYWIAFRDTCNSDCRDGYAKSAQSGTLQNRGTDNAPMVLVPAGEFTMGSDDRDPMRLSSKSSTRIPPCILDRPV